MKSYKLLSLEEETESGSRVWYAYVELVSPSECFNYQRYVNTMNPDAVNKFLELSHEKYYKEVGENFGNHILGIFPTNLSSLHTKAQSIRHFRKRLVHAMD